MRAGRRLNADRPVANRLSPREANLRTRFLILTAVLVHTWRSDLTLRSSGIL
jgi:hypothetical protein